MRTVFQAEARAWLDAQLDFAGVSFITSIPDLSETPALDVDAWKEWFTDTVHAIVAKCPDTGVAIFYQTDVLRGAEWIDKSYLCHLGATRAAAHCVWHKIVCRVPAGDATDGRPSYAHMLCFSRGVRTDGKARTADVLAQLGSMDWSRAMGRDACQAACAWVRAHTQTTIIVDPFCGTGTVLAVANELEFEAIGVDLDPLRAERARRKR